MDNLKTKWRPVFAWVFIAWFACLGFSLLALLWLKIITMNEAAGVIMAMIAAGGGITGTYAYKRSTEKMLGVTNDYSTETEVESFEPPPDFQKGN